MSTTTIIWSVFAIFALIVFIVVYYNMVIKPEKIKQQRMKNQSLLSEKQATLATLITIRNNKIKIVDKKIEQWLSSQAVDDSTDPDFSEVIRLYHQLGNCSEFERSDAIQRCFQKQLATMQPYFRLINERREWESSAPDLSSSTPPTNWKFSECEKQYHEYVALQAEIHSYFPQSSPNPIVAQPTFSSVEAQESQLQTIYQNIYKKYSSYSSCFSISPDHSYIEVQTNPNKIENYYNPKYWEILHAINTEFGIPDYIFQLMNNTSALQGRQTEVVNGYIVSWTYYPDHGLIATYRLAT